MKLAPGTRFGAYEVLSHVGSGGMGDVYRARDTRLGRIVALKLVRASSTSDEGFDRVAREAQLLASLHHPAIASVFALEDVDGARAIVQEFVEGPTLDEGLKRGPLPLAEAIALARQIAEALDVAHSRGIVHRDLKPANIKVTPDRRVKLLDFGLAKMFDDDGERTSVAETMSGTTARTVLGTPAYMSPEQATGAGVDRRADIWAFGCIVFEMLAGKRPFDGPSVATTLAAALHDQPDWSALPKTTPTELRRVLERCLEKDARRRLRDIGDVDWDLIAVPAAPAIGAAAGSRLKWRVVIAAAIAGVAVGASVVGVARFWPTRAADPQPAIVSSLILGNFSPSVVAGAAARINGSMVAISPDGRRIVYAGRRESPSLWIRALDRDEMTPIPGTEGVIAPFFSPDGRTIAFFAEAELRKVSLGGGQPQVIAELSGDVRGGTWLDDDTIVVGGDKVVRLSANGGSPTIVMDADPAGRVHYRWPSALPRSRGVLATKVTSNSIFELVAITFDHPEPITVLKSASSPRLIAGYIVFAPQLSADANARFGGLSAIAFDETSLKTAGAAFPVLDSLLVRIGGAAELDVSRDGSTMIAIPSLDAQNSLVWVDQRGQSRPFAPGDERAHFVTPRLSPDGARAAVTIQGSRAGVYIVDRATGSRQRLTTSDREHNYPVWSPDGRRIASTSDELGHIVWRNVDSNAIEGRVALNLHAHTTDWTRDGRFIIADVQRRDTDWDIVAIDTQSHDVIPLVESAGEQSHSRVSPDGRWLAYMSSQSGRSEVLVTAFRAKTPPIRISTDGGANGEWSRDGRELYYRRGAAMFVATVNASTSFSASPPRQLFSGDFVPSFDASSPDRQLLMLALADERAAHTVRLTINWLDDVRRRAAELLEPDGAR